MSIGNRFSMKKINRPVLWGYSSLIFLCFVLSWFLAGEYELLSICDDSWKIFHDGRDCEVSLSPLVVKMNAETIDSRVASFLPPGSYTPDAGWHLLGTDALGRDVFAGLLYGGQRSLMIGLISGLLAVGMGWFFGLWSIFSEFLQSSRMFFWIILSGVSLLALAAGLYLFLLIPAGILLISLFMKKLDLGRFSIRRGWWWGRGIEWYQALPDLLILMVLSVSIGIHQISTLILIIVAVVWPSVALVARRLGSEITGREFFQQAVRNRVCKKDLMIHYLWSNTRTYVWAVFPLIVGRIILLESTLSFLGLGLPPDIVTIGSMISEARDHIEAWWLIVFGSLFIFVLVYPLQRVYKNS